MDRWWAAVAPRLQMRQSRLGLAIVRRLVELDGGTVLLADAPGEGLEVVICYPRRVRSPLDPSGPTL